MVEILGEPEDLFRRIRKDTDCSNILTATDECFKIAREIFEKNEITAEDLSLECYKEIDPGYEDDEFETAPSHNVIIMYINDTDEENKTKYELLTQRKEEICQGQPKTVKVFPMTRAFTQEEEDKGYFSSVIAKKGNDKESKKADIIFGIKPDQTLLMIKAKPEEGISINTYEPENDEEKDKCVKMLKKAFCSMLDNNNWIASLALMNTIQKYNEKPNSNMNYLDLSNPESENEKTKDITTRELLKELQSRGLSFGKVEITVKQEVDLDSI